MWDKGRHGALLPPPLRDGDYIVNMVMEQVAAMGVKDITICASSLGAAHDPVAKLIEEGVVTGIQSSGVRGKIGEAISYGKLKTPAIIRSHGGRVRAIEEGDVHIDIAFIGAPTSDEFRKRQGRRRQERLRRALLLRGGRKVCGQRGGDHRLVWCPSPTFRPASPWWMWTTCAWWTRSGNPAKIVSNAVRMTRMCGSSKMAAYCTRLISCLPSLGRFFLPDRRGRGFLAVNTMLRPIMEEKDIHMSFAIGGITKPMCDLLDAGLVRNIVDAQAFDIGGHRAIRSNPRHFEISTSEYANPMNKGAFVNKLDFVILGALEVDVDYNVNVVTGSRRHRAGGPGRTRTPARAPTAPSSWRRWSRPDFICDRVVTVVTPGKCGGHRVDGLRHRN